MTAITAAIVCRAISAYENNRAESTILIKTTRYLDHRVGYFKCACICVLESDAEICVSTGWEKVTKEDCNWNMLISQLEDVTFLDSALK